MKRKNSEAPGLISGKAMVEYLDLRSGGSVAGRIQDLMDLQDIVDATRPVTLARRIRLWLSDLLELASAKLRGES